MLTLYERLGGESAIHAAATLLYDKALSDPRVNRFFAGMDVDALIRKQVAFLSYACGAPERYTYRPLAAAHRSLVREHGLSDLHFDVICEHLRDTLRELKVAPSLIDEVLQLIAGTREQVLRGS